jgi:hypothetical protein
MCIDIDMAILGLTVSLPVAPLVLTESFSTPKANLLVPSPTLVPLETTLLVAVVPTRYDPLERAIYESDITKFKSWHFDL